MEYSVNAKVMHHKNDAHTCFPNLKLSHIQLWLYWWFQDRHLQREVARLVIEATAIQELYQKSILATASLELGCVVTLMKIH